ncbi:hypothetical protein [Rhizohabitans arisaemae]|uniref:hypothetical protein n=1 Tax=Rhizohabitans arisaemae TaxID=2720610 RepID=UPI0024B07D4C|nr:hypothetical protein [Rhizohabitans arisaemae]
MSVLTSLMRARAVRRGRALPVATVRHLHLSPRPLVFVPLRLAGEAAAPLGAMVGADPADPRLLVVPQPRNRELRFAFMAELAEVVLTYLDGFGAEPAGGERFADAPQILVPNPKGIAFIRLLGRSTRFRRPDGPYPVPPSVPRLGTWLTFLAERGEHAGSSLLVALTQALGAHWATGQSAVEDGNLAAQLGWIDPPPGLTGPEAADAAEDPLRTPPAGPDTDPGFDRLVLERSIAAYDESGSPGQVRAALRTQLEPTWASMWQAVELLRRLPDAGSVAGRWERDRTAFTREYRRLAEGGAPQGRRDGAVGAAHRLARLEAAQQEFAAQCAFDDPLAMVEHLLSGKAFRGTVVEVDAARRIVPPGGKRASCRPLVVVEAADPVLIPPGKTVRSPRRPRQRAEILRIEGNRVTLQLLDGMGRAAVPEPGSVPEHGQSVCYADLDLGGGRRPPLPALEETPWTHGGPPAEYVPTDDDALEAWS